MSVKIDTAMVLAAGLGTRMRHLSANCPKPLIPVSGKPLIDYTLDTLAQAGVTKAIVNLHYLADMIEDHLRNKTTPAIIFSDERHQVLETGGGLVKAADQLGTTPFFCCNTDAILIDIEQPRSCSRMQSLFDEAEMDALLLLCPIEHSSGYEGQGDFALDETDKGLGRIRWRKDAAPGSPIYIYTGIQILHPRLLAGHETKPFSARVFWEQAMATGRAFGLIHQGDWMHVGDPEGLAIAEQRLTVQG